MATAATNTKDAQGKEGGHAQGGGHGSTASVIAAIAANILVGIVKFIAAGISGSAAMISEGIHSIVDSGNGLLVLLGLRQSKKNPPSSTRLALARNSTSGRSWCRCRCSRSVAAYRS